ncbi:FAD-binding domain-containing protein [Hymenopellis radicata]|nr:FAD-binding domain-containing protein [Hymenopellis radicata]
MGLLPLLLASLALAVQLGYSTSADSDQLLGRYRGLPTSSIPSSKWHALNATLGGKLHAAVPLAAPCFSSLNGDEFRGNTSECAIVETGYRNPFFRSDKFNAYTWPQWESCVAKEESCTLDPTSTNNSAAWSRKDCAQGSVSEFYVDVTSAKDVQTVFAFVQQTGVLVSIKNSGHDFGGRSAMKGSLSIWTRNLETISHDPAFVPEGGNTETLALTIGAGVNWYSVYKYAEANNITAVGGYHPTVGAAGGWLMGGGHSILSPVYGLGVDRVLQFKVVTPDGKYRVANEFRNQDLFWALRGGGGGTFGVVLECTIKAEPQIKLQVASLSFTQTTDNARGFLKLVIDNSVKWGTEGWGGHISAHDLVSVTPLLSLDEAKTSMQDAVDYTLAQNGTAIIEEVPSWLTFFEKYVSFTNSVGINGIGGSWLVPNTMFDNETTKEKLLDAIMPMTAFANPHITTATPYLFNYTAGSTSAAPAWRNSLWHAVFQYMYPWNATQDAVRAGYQTITDNIQLLRDIAPESGAYGNEADIYDPDHERAFWGDNYPKLLELKQKFDPVGLLDCWYCVGWRGADNSRFQCYVSE